LLDSLLQEIMSLLMLPRISSTIMKTIRTLSSTITMSNIHIQSTSQAKMTPEMKKSSTLKTKKLVKAEPSPALCPILSIGENKTVQKELGQDLLIDTMVGYILAENIRVPMIALLYNVSVFQNNLDGIPRKSFPNNLDTEIKVGRFTARDDQIIMENWSFLQKQTKREPFLEENEATTEIFLNAVKDQGLKNNIVGHFLSQGLPNARLATEVFHRAKILLCAKKGFFSPEEDQIITQFVEKEGRKWAALAKRLERSARAVKERYEVMTNEYEVKDSQFTAGEDEIIICEVFNANKNILMEKNITTEDWKRIGKKLGRNHLHVQQRWSTCLEPTLTRHHAGTLNMDIRKVLLEHLLENNMQFAQDVDWKELAMLPKFAGATSQYLHRKWQDMRTSTRRNYPELSEDKLNTEEIQRWYNNSKRNNTEKKDAYYEGLVAFYLANIKKKIGDK